MGDQSYTVAVIGDGSFTGGLAFEGMNNSGRFNKNFIVVLNDNKMSISPNVGALSRYLTTVRIQPWYMRVKKITEKNSFTHSAYRKTSEKISSGRKV